jgi:phosphonate transport system substrate-binding protein
MLTRRILVLGLASLPLSAGAQDMPAPGKRAWAAQVPEIRIGLLGGENDADRLARYDGYRKLLEETFAVPARMLMAADYAGVIQAFAAGQIEVAYMSPAAYAAAWIQSNGDVEPLLTTQEKDGTTSYVSVMYTRADSGVTSLEDMKGHSLAWADPNSASGYLIPRAEFRAQKLDPDSYFSRTGFAGGHEQAVIAVLNHQYDAGVTWTSGIGDASEGYTRGALRSMVDKKLLDMKDLCIIWKSRPIENGPLTVRKSTPDAFRADMLAFHIALPKAHPDIYHAVDMGSGQAWVRVQHSDYQIFVDLLKQEAAERHKRN